MSGSSVDPAGPATNPTAGLDRIEAEQVAFHERVRDGFRRLADSAPDRYVVLDGNRLPQTLHSEIRHVISERLHTDLDPVAADPYVRPTPAETVPPETMTAEMLPDRATTKKAPSAR